MSTRGLLDIMTHYARYNDPVVRCNLCDALVADGSPHSAQVLLDLATQDADEGVSAFAAQQITRLNQSQLQAVQPTLAQRFDPKQGKAHILNWVRCADRIAKGTHTPIFDGIGAWMTEVLASRKLNRRLLFSRKNEYGFAARLLNRYVVISAILAVVLTVLLALVLIDNMDEDVLLVLLIIGPASVLFGAIPLAVMFAPPDLAFRRSAIGFVDALIVLGFGAVLCLIAWLFGFLIGDLPDSEFFAPVVFYIILPLFCVRLALNAAIRIKQRLVYPLLLCLIVIGVLVLVYGIQLLILDRIDPYWYYYGETMGWFLWYTLPIALFMALHQGSRGNVVLQTGEATRTLFFNRLRWRIFAGVAAIFVAVVALAPASGMNPPGRGEAVLISLWDSQSEVIGVKSLEQKQNEEQIEKAELDILNELRRLLSTMELQGGGRHLTSQIEDIVAEISAGTSPRRITEMATELLDLAYTSPDNSLGVDPFEQVFDQLDALSRLVASSDVAETRQTVRIKRENRVILSAPIEGDLEIDAQAFRNGRPTNVVLWVNGFQIDDQSWNDPEVFQDPIDAGDITIMADIAAPTIDPETVIEHFRIKIAYVLDRYLFLDMNTTGPRGSEPVELDFEIGYVWTPRIKPVVTWTEGTIPSK